jgi:hypothetical protein
LSRSQKIVGTREWEQDIYQHVAAHGQLEGEILEEYKELADDEETSPAFSYLARMILEDEVRHHRIFDELAETFRQMGADTPDRSPIPSLRGFHADRVCIKRVTERLLEVEQDDLRELKDLAKRLKDFDNITIWGLLIELMLDDTKKHIKILKFIRDRSKDQPD